MEVPGPDGPWAAVDGVSFDLARGETFALVGESGCGKSLTALALARLLPPGAQVVAGSVVFRGHELLTLPERAMRDVRGLRMAMVFQEPATSLNPVMTVGDQVAEVLLRHGKCERRAAASRVLELFDAVGIPDPGRRLGEYPFQLSGGLRQRVMIAMAIACEPDLLIADEPTTALDVTLQAQVLDLLADLQRRSGMALLLITHDLGVVARMAHRVAVMYAGQLVESAPAAEFFAAPAHPYARKLFAALPGAGTRGRSLASIPGAVPAAGAVFTGCRFSARCEHARPHCEASPPRLLPTVAGRGTLRCHRDGELPAHVVSPAGPHAGTGTQPGPLAGEALLEVTGLKVHFPMRGGLWRRVRGQVRAVDGVDLRIPAGQTLALVGESGCGKTTVGKAVVRLLDATAGRVVVAGTDLTALGQRQLRPRRKDFQMVFQDPFSSLNPRMRVSEILEEGMRALEPARDAVVRAARVDELLRQVGLEPGSASRYPHEFSGGQRQRIAIARALAVQPRLLVCDEPTSALDVSVQAQILNLLRDLQGELGLSYLFITHNLAVVRHLAHEVAVMYLGRVVEQGRAEDVLDRPAHPYTRLLLASVPDLAPGAAAAPAGAAAEMPSSSNPPPGCHFRNRCDRATEVCARDYPDPRDAAPGHRVRCHHPG